MKTLRDYQQKAQDALISYMENYTGNPLVVAPVGAGKSLLIAEFIRHVNETYGKTRIMVLAHVSELLVQNSEELRGQWPQARIGIYADKLGRKQLGADITFASIQSIYKKGLIVPHVPELLIIDEAHLLNPKSGTMYKRFIEDLKTRNPDIKVIGYTGTPFRPNSGYLTEGKDRLFTDVAFEIPMLYLIERGFLAPVVAPTMDARISTEGVGIVNGDYNEKQLQERADDQELIAKCVDEIIAHSAGRKKWLVFTCGIKHCHDTCQELIRRGVKAAYITGETPTDERNDIINRFKNGDIQCVVNVAVLTTGFNNPSIDLIAFMRPTRSEVLYIQCVGRGMRTAEGKTDCLLLDFGGVVETLGCVDKVKVKKKEGTGDAPIKTCPSCLEIVYAATRTCVCGHEFEFEKGEEKVKKHAKKDIAVLSNQIKPKQIKIMDVRYSRHISKNGKPDMLKVAYYSLGHKVVYEYVFFNHPEGTVPRIKATNWAMARGIKGVNDVSTALTVQWPKPEAIEILKNDSGYYEVKNVQF